MARDAARSASSEAVVRIPRLTFEKGPGDAGHGEEALHVHVHFPGRERRAGRLLLGVAGGGIALVAAFLAGVISAAPSGSAQSSAELAALQRLAALPPLPAIPESGQPAPAPLLPPSGAGVATLPTGLQQMLAQPPRVQLPPGAPSGSAAAAPVVQGTAPRNAFGLER
jgi:hypothetical protein